MALKDQILVIEDKIAVKRLIFFVVVAFKARIVILRQFCRSFPQLLKKTFLSDIFLPKVILLQSALPRSLCLALLFSSSGELSDVCLGI